MAARKVSNSFPFVEVRGAPREMGRQHGEACREQVRRYADTLLAVLSGEAALRSLDGDSCGDGTARGPAAPAPEPAARPHLTREDLYTRALTFLPFIEGFAPHLVEEIRGIAEGASVPFEAALLVNVRAEVAGLTSVFAPAPVPRTSLAALHPVEGCTSFSIGRDATASGMFTGQNQDQDPAMEELGVVLRLKPDQGPPMVMATFGGLVGYPGMNAAGIAFGQNALSNGTWRHSMPHYPLKRVLLEQTSLDGCLAAIERASLASCGNMALGDAGSGRVLDVEATPEGYATVEPERGVVAHTNHFRSPRFAPQERLLGSLPDSAARLDLFSALMQEAHGHITLDTVKSALRDHTLGATGICRHEPDRPVKTIASIIAEPDAGLLHVARGNPCENEYVSYSVE